MRKSAGTGTTTLDGQFDGTAPTFDVRAGTILLRDSSTWTGGARIDTRRRHDLPLPARQRLLLGA